MLSNTYITKHFKHSEFACPCCKTRGIDERIVWVLELLRSIANQPIIILSGYRCLKHNREIGGAERSKHLEGTAVDFTCKDLDHLAILLRNWSGGFKYYRDRNFIHIDLGPMRRW